MHKIYEYKEIVKGEDKTLFLGPGVRDNFGGMYSYILLWLDEIEKFPCNKTFLLKNNFEVVASQKVLKENIYSENQLFIKISSAVALILPVQLYSFFFKKDYKKIILEHTVIHILTASITAYALIRSVFYFKKNIKIIFTLHDPSPHDEKISFFGRIIKKRTLKRIYKLSKTNNNLYIHLHSKNLLKDCPNHIGNVIIYSHPLPKRLVAKKNNSHNKKIRFGFLGRIEPYKGLDVMFDAFKSIECKICDNCEIVIVGYGTFDKEKWINNLGCDVLIKNEKVSDMYFHQQMNSLDCLILPYKKASQSGVGYLAVAYDIPIIATNTGGLPDIVKISNKKSKLVEPNNSKDLAEAIEFFIQ